MNRTVVAMDSCFAGNRSSLQVYSDYQITRIVQVEEGNKGLYLICSVLNVFLILEWIVSFGHLQGFLLVYVTNLWMRGRKSYW